jgi:cytochrome c oxidase subunit III
MNSTDIYQPKHSRRFAENTLLLVLGAETVLFGTLVMSYLFLRTSGTNMGFLHLQPIDLILAGGNTLVLLASAVLAWRAAQAIKKDNVKGLKTDLAAALALGAVFVLGQIFEFDHSGLTITGTIFGGAFFALVSFHALHVLAGMTLLALNLARAYLGDFSARRRSAITIGTWFWTYVAGVWLVLFTVLYLV